MKLTMTVLTLCQNVCVYWAVLTIYGVRSVVNATMELEDSRRAGSHDSVHQLKLKLLPVRTGDGTHELQVSNASNTSEKIHSVALTLTKILTSRKRQVQKKTQRQSNLISVNQVTETSQLARFSDFARRYKRTPIMAEFRKVYTNFYKTLQVFVNLLSVRFKQETPSSVHNIKQITNVMPLDDMDISRRNVNNIIQKFFIIQEVVKVVLLKIEPFVKSEYSQWLKNQSKILKWRMNIVGFMMLSLQIRGIDVEMSYLPSGISGINYGVYVGLNLEALLKLKELMEILQK